MKKHNFNAGPSILPREVIEQTAQAVLDYNGSGLSILEISHRAKDFQPVVDEAVALFKELLDIPEVPAVDEDHPLEETVVEFTVEEDGVYYYAFHVYSPAFHEILYLSNIRVEEKDNGSAIDTLVSGSSVAVLPGKGCIRIANPKGETVGIYSLNGVKLMEADESMMNAEVPSGVYLVRTKDEVRKVLVY